MLKPHQSQQQQEVLLVLQLAALLRRVRLH
jgi:hypothetical protein